MRSMSRLLLLGCLALLQPGSAGPLGILSELKNLRDGAVKVFEEAAESLTKDSLKEAAKQVEQWNNDWLSLLSVRKGLPGLAKDFTLNYLGRSSYHDYNGQLLDAIKAVAASFPVDGKVDDKAAKALRNSLTSVCREGLALFQVDGALGEMLQQLSAMLQDEKIFDALRKSVSESSSLQAAFSYLMGPAPDKSAQEEL
mmetsp:Transcript_28642/g.66021  ORF Transcript_28642/g.66021 Transcript_28642/m.66021 type:complete len:198 (-) Transcript_28642:154-747(-)